MNTTSFGCVSHTESRREEAAPPLTLPELLHHSCCVSLVFDSARTLERQEVLLHHSRSLPDGVRPRRASHSGGLSRSSPSQSFPPACVLSEFPFRLMPPRWQQVGNRARVRRICAGFWATG